jgi:hypothetical protein
MIERLPMAAALRTDLGCNPLSFSDATEFVND